MGRYLTLTNSKITKIGYKKRAISLPVTVGPVAFKFIIIGLLMILGLFFISQSNEASLRGYKIRDLEEQRNRLADENQKLNIQVAQLKSLGNLENKDMNLVTPSEVNYLPAESPVAVTK